MNTLFQLISHEYRKYVFTRGFLLMMLIIPLSGAFGFFASQFTEDSAPVRAFFVVDDTGDMIDVIDRALAEDQIERDIEAWDSYVVTAVDLTGPSPALLVSPFAPSDVTAARREAFAAAGGLERAIEVTKPLFVENAPPPPGPQPPRFVRVQTPSDVLSASLDEREDLVRAYVRGEKTMEGQSRDLFAGVVIPRNFRNDPPGSSVFTNTLLENDLRAFIDRAITDAVRVDAYVGEGVDAARAKRIADLEVSVRSKKADVEESAEATEIAVAESIIPLVLAYLLFVMVMSIGGMLLTSTIEEKSNKIVEVLLSSVSAGQLMASKLIGLALVGLTIPTIFLSLGFVATEILGDQAVAGSTTAALFAVIKSALFQSPLIPLFFMYFVIGYLLFASIYLAIGATSGSIQDAQSFVGPLTILLILPAPFLPLVIQNPNGLFATILTWIPLYTPYAVMIRMSANPPLWEIVGATALLIAVVIIVLNMMGRIYRNGVLSSGGAPSLKQLRDLSKKSAD